jgi:hypothetical protein
LDPRLSPEDLAAVRKQTAEQSNIVKFYSLYLSGLGKRRSRCFGLVQKIPQTKKQDYMSL